MPSVFRPDGPYSSAYAAQALAARGMAVLGVNLPTLENEKNGIGNREGHTAVEMIDASVMMLARSHRIDPERVGVVGHSRGGFDSLYAITHPGKIKLAAAIGSDSFQTNYSSYIDSAARSFPNYVSGALDTFEQQMDIGGGGGSFWLNEAGWLQESTEFNIDKVDAPYMFVGNGLNLDYFQVFSNLMGMFTVNRRPLEVLNIPLGAHPYIRPREREASMTATVDWMDFWLQGHEVPTTVGNVLCSGILSGRIKSDWLDCTTEGLAGLRHERDEKYARWRRMRADWQAQRAWEGAGHPSGAVPE